MIIQMGEALISRAGGGGEVESIIPITPGYHTILATLKAADGRTIPNAVINCRDGSLWYNYTTNDKGQALFVCNSGSANFFISNVIEGIMYCDITDTNINIDAPVGATTRLNLMHNNASSFIKRTSGMFYLLSSRNVNMHLVGGGGGGGGGFYNYKTSYGGGGGGAGYMNNYNINLPKGAYNLVIGSGGLGGLGFRVSNKYGFSYNSTINGSSGGTTYIANTSYSAIGGSGGCPQHSSIQASGGLGNGGYQSRGNGEASPVTYAGGGGACGGGWNSRSYYGGSPYGGYGAYSYQLGQSVGVIALPGSGSNAGGGGGLVCSSYTNDGSDRGGSGGSGLMCINFLN